MNKKLARKLLENTTISYTARLGQEIKLDIKRSACERFGFYIGERVITPKGIATVIGVKVGGDGSGMLWVHVDGDSGASYWDNGVSEKDLIETLGFKKTEEKLSYDLLSVKMLIQSLAKTLSYEDLPYFDIQEKDELDLDDVQNRFRIIHKFFKCPDCGKPLRSHNECTVDRLNREDKEQAQKNQNNSYPAPSDKMKCPYCKGEVRSDAFAEHIALCETKQQDEVFNIKHSVITVFDPEAYDAVSRVRTLSVTENRTKSRVPTLTTLTMNVINRNWDLYETWNLLSLMAGEQWPPTMHYMVNQVIEKCIEYIIKRHKLFNKDSKIHSLSNDMQDLIYRYAIREPLVFNTVEAAEAIEYLNSHNFPCKRIIDAQLHNKETIIRILHYGIMSANPKLVEICLTRLAKDTNLLDFQALPYYDKLDSDIQRALENKLLQIEPEPKSEIEDPMELYISSYEEEDIVTDEDEDDFIEEEEEDEDEKYNSDDSTDM